MRWKGVQPPCFVIRRCYAPHLAYSVHHLRRVYHILAAPASSLALPARGRWKMRACARRAWAGWLNVNAGHDTLPQGVGAVFVIWREFTRGSKGCFGIVLWNPSHRLRHAMNLA
jgi:hypothetical protein